MADIPEFVVSDASMDASLALPILEEQLCVGTRRVDTGRGVRLIKSVAEQPYSFEQLLLHDEIEIRHIPVDEIVALEAAPGVRHEGETLIVPVLEEVLVVEKRLRIREEIRITRVRRETRHTETVLLKSEQVRVERFDEAPATPDK